MTATVAQERRTAPLLLRMDEAADLLGISRTKAYGLVRAGQLPAIRVGQSIRINRLRLERWIEENTAEAAS